MDAKLLDIAYSANLKKGRTVWIIKFNTDMACDNVKWPSDTILKESFRLLHSGTLEIQASMRRELWVNMRSGLSSKIRAAVLAIIASHM